MVLELLTAWMLLACIGSVRARDECGGALVKISLQQQPQEQQHRATRQLLAGPATAPEVVWGVQAPFGKQLLLNETLSASLRLAEPLDACSSLQGSGLAGADLAGEMAMHATTWCTHMHIVAGMVECANIAM